MRTPFHTGNNMAAKRILVASGEKEPPLPETFRHFAGLHFSAENTATFITCELGRPLLVRVRGSDGHTAKKIWKTILRFMGDYPDEGPQSEVNTASTTNLTQKPTVMTQLYEQYGVSWSHRELRRRSTKTRPETRVSTSSMPEEPTSPTSPTKPKSNLRRLRSVLSKQKEVSLMSDEQRPLSEDDLHSPLDQIHYIIGHGILRHKIRDEIYSQLCKQLSQNPSKSSQARGWLLLSLCAGCFSPSTHFLPCLREFVRDSPAHACLQLLENTLERGHRHQPSSNLEFESAVQRKILKVSVTLMDGSIQSLPVDATTTSGELCSRVADAVNLNDRFGFSVYIAMHDKVASLGSGSDYVMDAISQCEQIFHEQEVTTTRGQVAPWRLFFRKEIFAPWHDANLDDVATKLIYAQIVRGVSLGEYRCDLDEELATMSAQQYYIDYGADISPDLLYSILPSYIPPQKRNTKSELTHWRKGVLKAHKRMFGVKGGSNIPKQMVREDIVGFARTKWANAFSRFYDAKMLQGGELSNSYVSLAVNWQGLHVIEHLRTVLKVRFVEIATLAADSGDSRYFNGSRCLTVMLASGATYRFSSRDVDDLHGLLVMHLDGLKQRSRYLAVLHDSGPLDERNGKRLLRVRRGDLLYLDSCEGDNVFNSDTCSAICLRTGQRGICLTANVHLLPTLDRPTRDVLELFEKD